MSRRETHVNLDAGKLLGALRARAWSAADLAAKAGVSPTTLSGLIHHGRPVSTKTARRIAAALVATQPIDGLVDILPDQEVA